MSDSPQSNPKDVEQGAPSGDDEAQMNDPQDPQSTGLGGYEFEVKEQDRWLPIANGMLKMPSSSKLLWCFHSAMIRLCLWRLPFHLNASVKLAWRRNPP